MMEAVAEKWTADFKDLRTAVLTLEIPREKLSHMPAAGTKVSVSIREFRKRRGLDANAYMWLICEKIARAVGCTTREEIYRGAIRAVGKYETVYMIPAAAERFIVTWRAKGLGFLADALDYRVRGYVPVNIYYGSHTYTTDEMARIIGWLREEAEQLGLDVDTPAEKSRYES